MREEFLLAEGTPIVAAFTLSPRMGCTRKERVVVGDSAQASPSDASRLDQCSMFLQCMISSDWRKRSDSPLVWHAVPCRTGWCW